MLNLYKMFHGIILANGGSIKNLQLEIFDTHPTDYTDNRFYYSKETGNVNYLIKEDNGSVRRLEIGASIASIEEVNEAVEHIDEKIAEAQIIYDLIVEGRAEVLENLDTIRALKVNVVDLHNATVTKANQAANSAANASETATRVEEIENNLNITYDDVVARHNNIKGIQTDVTTKRANVLSAETRINSSESNVTAMKSEVTSLRNATATDRGVVSDKLDAVTQKANTVALQHAQVAEDTEAVSEMHATVNSKAATVNTQHNTVNSKAAQVATNTAKVAEDLADVEARQADVVSKNNNVNSKAATVNSQNANVNTKHADVVSKAGVVGTKHADVVEKHEDIDGWNTNVDAKNANVNTKSSNVDTKHSDVVTKHSDVTTKAAAVHSQSLNVNAKHGEVVTLHSEVGDMHEDIDGWNANVDSKNANVNSKAATVDSQNANVNTKNNNVNNKHTEVVNKHSDVVTKWNEVNSKAATVNTQNTNVNSKHSDVVSKANTVTTKHNQVTGMWNDVSGWNDTIEVKLNTINTVFSDIEDNASEISTSLEYIVAKSDDVTSKYDAVVTKHADVVSKNNNVNSKAATVNSQNANVNTKHGEVAEMWAEVSDWNDNVNSKNANVNSKAATVATQTTNVNNKYNDINNKHTDIVNRYNTVVSKADTVNAQNTSVNTKHADVVSKASQVASDRAFVADVANSYDVGTFVNNHSNQTINGVITVEELIAPALSDPSKTVKSYDFKINARSNIGNNDDYFDPGEIIELFEIQPTGSSQNYYLEGTVVLQASAYVTKLDIRATVRSNSMPDLDVTGSYSASAIETAVSGVPFIWYDGSTDGKARLCIRMVNANVHNAAGSFKVVSRGNYPGAVKLIATHKNDTKPSGYTEKALHKDIVVESNDLTFREHKVYHAGNHGAGSGLSADTLQGEGPEFEAVAYSIVKRGNAGDIKARLFRSTYPDQTTMQGSAGLAFRNEAGNDNFVRFMSDKSYIRTWLGVPTVTHTHSDYASGISSLNSKVSALELAETDNVKQSTNQTIGGDKRFIGTSNFVGPITIEEGKHCIVANDGSGNFNIKVGLGPDNSFNSTEPGYASHWTFDQSQGQWTFKTSEASRSTGENHTCNPVMTIDRNGNVTFAGSVNGTGTNIKANSSVNSDKLGGINAGDFVRKTGGNTLNGLLVANKGIKVKDSRWSSGDDGFTVEGIEPNIRFVQTDNLVNWFAGVNSSSFYLLSDTNGDGSFDSSPYAFQLTRGAPLKINGNSVYDQSNANLNSVDWKAKKLDLSGNLYMETQGQRIIFSENVGSASYIENNGGSEIIIATDATVAFKETDADVNAVVISTNDKTITAPGGFKGTADNANKLDNLDSSKFLRSDATTVFNDGNASLRLVGSGGNIYIQAGNASVNGPAPMILGGYIGSRLPRLKLVSDTVIMEGSDAYVDKTLTVGRSSSFDAHGNAVVWGHGYNSLVIQTDDNEADRGLAYRNSGGAYTGAIYAENIGNNLANLVFSTTGSSNVEVESAKRMRITYDGKIEMLGNMYTDNAINLGPESANDSNGYRLSRTNGRIVLESLTQIDILGDQNGDGGNQKVNIRSGISGDTLSVGKSEMTFSGHAAVDTIRSNRSYYLPAGYDLDTLVQGGEYDCSNPTSRPDNLSRWWYIKVQRHSNSGTYCLQEVTALTGPPAKYYRTRDAGGWNAWIPMAGEPMEASSNANRMLFDKGMFGGL